jgi:5S rRNA maturation endonuclease (ribonuclease M5)
MVVPHYIRDYLLEKFKENYRLSSGDSELIVPSIFIADDYKRHMSINLDTGLWQCFKSGNKGNFIQLYAFLEDLTYNKAEAEILFKELEDPTQPKRVITKPTPTNSTKNLELIEVTLGDYDTTRPLVQRAWVFLYERGLFNLETQDSTFYVSEVNGRLIIPFSHEGKLFYYQARALEDETPKYLNPSEGWPKPSNILYPYDEEEDHLVVCEGPLDAISLQNQGVNATCTMGCSVSDQQIEQLKEFEGKIIIGYDNDDAGKRGVNRFDYLRRIKRMADIYICHPPLEVKDWNEAHVKGFNLREFVDNQTKRYDYNYLMDHLLTTL